MLGLLFVPMYVLSRDRLLYSRDITLINGL